MRAMDKSYNIQGTSQAVNDSSMMPEETLLTQLSDVAQTSLENMQHFLNGELSMQQLAESMKPSPIFKQSPHEIGPRTPSYLESNLQQFKPSSSYLYQQAFSTLSESPVNIRSGSYYTHSPTVARLSPANAYPVPIQESAHSSQNVFKSPLTPVERAQLMELQTVTPSRILNSPRTLCDVTIEPVNQIGRSKSFEGKVSSPAPAPSTSFTLPPTPLRLRTSDGTVLKPTIDKDPSGNITIIYPLEGLANASFSSPEKKGTSESSSNCQFPVSTGTPYNQEHATTSRTLESTSQFTYPIGIQITENQPDPRADGIDNVEDDDAEDRENVRNITQALNIQCDVYKENKEHVKKNTMRARNQLPKEYSGLMGEANLCYARGDNDDAIKMCMEIIRLAPYCPDPFETLAMIYDERREKTKARQYSILAAHLRPTDAEQWVRLAEGCEEAGDIKQALYCYNKGIKKSPSDYSLYWRAAVFNQQLGNLKQALELFKTVVKLMPESEVKKCMELARDIAKACHANNETNLAVEVMQEASNKHTDHVEYEDTNMLCELYLALKQYENVFYVMEKYCNVKTRWRSDGAGDNENKVVEDIDIPPNFPVDLSSKIIIACIHSKSFEKVKPLYENICAMNTAECGDLQFDIAEALIDAQNLENALRVLDILVKSPDYSLAAVWLKKGECHEALKQPLEQMKSYREVVKLAPGNTKAYLALCKVLRQLARFREALEAVEEAETYEMGEDEQMYINYERFIINKEWAAITKKKRHEKLCKASDMAIKMLSSRMEGAFIQSKTIVLKRIKRSNKRYMGDIKLTRVVGSNFYKYANTRSAVAKGSLNIFNNEEWWSFFKDTLDILIDAQRFVDGITLADAALGYSPWYYSLPMRRTIEQYAITICMLSGNHSMAYSFIRLWLNVETDNNQYWNLFNQITARSGDQRHHRYCLRSLVRQPRSIALAILTGHNSLTNGTYKHSLGEYARAYKQIPTEPLYPLLLGVIYTHIATQKFTTHKNSLVIQSLAFLHKYRQQRKCDQEALYNIGRALHQLGLVHFATIYYKKALTCAPPEVEDVDGSLLDLKREIAYNLSVIYRASGNKELAISLIEEYCVI